MQQLKRGSLEMILLKLIRDYDCTYGYAIISALGEIGGEIFRNSKPGTVYPILYRMEECGWICVNTDESGKTQKRYALTSAGEKELEKMIADWNEYVSCVNNFLEEKK